MEERIESFTEEYLDACASVLVSAFNSDPWNENWTFANAKKELARTLSVPWSLGFISVDGEEVLGFAEGCREQDGDREVFYLETLCVRPHAQGFGTGSRLLQHLKKELEQAGINAIYLITHKGTPAESLYKKNGYQVSEEDVVMIHEW